jgi:hypothetical protein
MESTDLIFRNVTQYSVLFSYRKKALQEDSNLLLRILFTYGFESGFPSTHVDFCTCN